MLLRLYNLGMNYDNYPQNYMLAHHKQLSKHINECPSIKIRSENGHSIYLVNNNGISGTGIFVELCAMPDKMPFYEKFGFEANEAQRLKMMYRVK